jgi:fatty-acyl-CoA synthase
MIPAAGTLLDAIRWWAVERRDEPALVSAQGNLTHGELDAWAARVADWLVEQGIAAGERITIIATNCLEWCVMAQGALRAGVLLAPINPRFTLSEADHVLGRYEPRLVFHDPARQDLAEALRARHPEVRCFPLALVHELRTREPARSGTWPAIDADTPVVIIGTSGSTGYPKGVVYSHRTMLAGYTDFALAEAWAADRPRVMVFGPLCVSAGYYVFTEMLVFGGTAYLEDNFDAARALRRVEEDRITILMGVPVFFERMAACPAFAGTDLSSLRMVQSGGARVSQQLIETWAGRGLVFQQLYGQTEAGGTATINPRSVAASQPDKCGRGMPMTRLAIIDEQGRFCAPGVPGEIVVRGPAVMVGYWRDPEATAQALVDGWLRTGDLGVMDEHGLLTMIDRIKDIIISGGMNIAAAEVERVVADFPGVAEVAVIAAKDERFGETPMAVVYAPQGLDVPGLVRHCNEHLSDYKVVRYIAVRDEPLPRVAAGKISKPELRKLYADAHLTLQKVR